MPKVKLLYTAEEMAKTCLRKDLVYTGELDHIMQNSTIIKKKVNLHDNLKSSL